MNSGRYWAVRCGKHLAAVLRQPKSRPQEILCGSRTETNDNLGADGSDFGLEPRAASRDLEGVRFLVQPDFAPLFPFKVLHGIGDVNRGPIDTGRLQALIQQLAGGSYKRPTLLIFAIARLFTNEKHRSMCRSLAKHHLCRALVKIASVALRGRLAQTGKIVARW